MSDLDTVRAALAGADEHLICMIQALGEARGSADQMVTHLVATGLGLGATATATRLATVLADFLITVEGLRSGLDEVKASAEDLAG